MPLLSALINTVGSLIYAAFLLTPLPAEMLAMAVGFIAGFVNRRLLGALLAAATVTIVGQYAAIMFVRMVRSWPDGQAFAASILDLVGANEAALLPTGIAAVFAAAAVHGANRLAIEIEARTKPRAAPRGAMLGGGIDDHPGALRAEARFREVMRR